MEVGGDMGGDTGVTWKGTYGERQGG